MIILQSVHSVHKFLQRQLSYPLVLSTLLAVAFYIGRTYFTRYTGVGFLMWNLFLAWIPYLCALWIAYLRQRSAPGWQYLVPSALWLLFFPNAAYLVTDLYNLQATGRVPLWYDIGLFTTCAWTGLLLAVVSLHIMQELVKEYVGALASWVFVLAVVGLNGLGIYLGRFLRWNSWDVFTDPVAVLSDAIAPLLHPVAHREPLGVTVMFGAVLLVCYLTLIAFKSQEKI